MIILNVINNLIVEILVSLILTVVKLFVNPRSKQSKHQTESGNIFLEHNYGHWERTILWLEDIVDSKFSYLSSQVKFITIVIGMVYGTVAGVVLSFANNALFPELDPIGVLLLSIVIGAVFGVVGGKSLTERPPIFDLRKDEFRGDFFD